MEITHCGTNAILFRACLVWNKLPLSVKKSQSLNLNPKLKLYEKLTALAKFAVYNFVLNTD